MSPVFVTALESRSQGVNHPTSVIMITNTYTTVSTSVPNVVSGTVTVPTALFSTNSRDVCRIYGWQWREIHEPHGAD